MPAIGTFLEGYESIDANLRALASTLTTTQTKAPASKRRLEGVLEELDLKRRAAAARMWRLQFPVDVKVAVQVVLERQHGEIERLRALLRSAAERMPLLERHDQWRRHDALVRRVKEALLRGYRITVARERGACVRIELVPASSFRPGTQGFLMRLDGEGLKQRRVFAEAEQVVRCLLEMADHRAVEAAVSSLGQ